MRVTRQYSWDMGHRLKGHEGLCRNLHGHRYVAEVTVHGAVQAGEGPECGMVVDFFHLDAAIAAAIGGWDHAVMLQDGDPLLTAMLNFVEASQEQMRIIVVPWPPTAEHMAIEIGAKLHECAPKLSVERVRVWETPRSWAEWGAQ